MIGTIKTCQSKSLLDSVIGELDFGILATTRKKENLGASSSAVICITFSPDGRTLVSGDEHGEVKLWDLVTAQELFSLVGHTGPVYCTAFSPDGETLATAGASADRKRGEIKFWRAVPITNH